MMDSKNVGDEKLARKHDFDAAWKSILEAFEVEIVELLFPEIFDEIAWEKGTESLDNELREIQKEIFDKDIQKGQHQYAEQHSHKAPSKGKYSPW